MEDVHVPPSTSSLDLSRNRIRKLTFHDGIPNVVSLCMENTLVRDIADVILPSSLRYLYFDGANLEALVFHPGLKNLQQL
ncbi:hypothetical protein PINS_up016658 [Pythium insidiosum]|nr:hypothetical protein PINS_up016658 [Pythium insidiosum]